MQGFSKRLYNVTPMVLQIHVAVRRRPPPAPFPHAGEATVRSTSRTTAMVAEVEERLGELPFSPFSSLGFVLGFRILKLNSSPFYF